MDNVFSFTPFAFNAIQGGYGFENSDKMEVNSKGKQDQIFGKEDLGEANNPFSFEYYQEKTAQQGEHRFFKDQQSQPEPNYDSVFGEFQFASSCPTAETTQEIAVLDQVRTEAQEPVQPNKQTPHPFSLSSLELLKNYGSGFKKLKRKQSSSKSHEPNTPKLSTEEIMRVAGARFVQFSDSQRYVDISMVMHPFGWALSGLSEEEKKDVELVHLLLATAEKVGYQQFERASRLLSSCEWIASEKSNPLQRVVHCFAEALRDRIDKETGRFVPKEPRSKEKSDSLHGLSTNVTFLSCHQQLPLTQVPQFAATQVIMENVASAAKLHFIDLEIRSGVQWTVLMQALKERRQRPVQLLKITAIGLLEKRQKIEETGKRLKSFAESLNFPFSFTAVYVSDLKDIKEDLFQIRKDEYLGINSFLLLRTMIPRPSCLENLMRMIKNLNPSIMVITEVEANHNSPSFVNRFIETLFFYGAYFDCLETCMGQNVELRTKMEEILQEGIHNIVAMEGSERTARSVKMEVWRAFFARFRMVEIGISESALYQANLVVKQYPYASCCTLVKNGRSLITGWKGMPVHSLSVWKFGRPFLHYRF